MYVRWANVTNFSNLEGICLESAPLILVPIGHPTLGLDGGRRERFPMHIRAHKDCPCVSHSSSGGEGYAIEGLACRECQSTVGGDWLRRRTGF